MPPVLDRVRSKPSNWWEVACQNNEPSLPPSESSIRKRRKSIAAQPSSQITNQRAGGDRVKAEADGQATKRGQRLLAKKHVEDAIPNPSSTERHQANRINPLRFSRTVPGIDPNEEKTGRKAVASEAHPRAPRLSYTGKGAKSKSQSGDQVGTDEKRKRRSLAAEADAISAASPSNLRNKMNGESSNARNEVQNTVPVESVISRSGTNKLGRPNKYAIKGKEERSTKRKKIDNKPGAIGRSGIPHHAEEIDYVRGEEEDQAGIPNYQRLAAVTRKVTLQAIEDTWSPLPPACIERIAYLLLGLQPSVVMHLTEEKKKMQATTAVDMVSRRLLNKLSRGIPFPHPTCTHREDDFDYEKILDYNQSMTAQLIPLLHSNQLLESELHKEKVLLAAEGEVLSRLEFNAKSETSRIKQDERKQHNLVQRGGSACRRDELHEHLGLDNSSGSVPTMLEIQKEPDLMAIINITSGHMDSMQSNMRQIEGIVEAMAKTKAAVQATIFDHLDPIRYEDVVLG